MSEIRICVEAGTDYGTSKSSTVNFRDPSYFGVTKISLSVYTTSASRVSFKETLKWPEPFRILSLKVCIFEPPM